MTIRVGETKGSSFPQDDQNTIAKASSLKEAIKGFQEQMQGIMHNHSLVDNPDALDQMKDAILKLHATSTEAKTKG